MSLYRSQELYFDSIPNLYGPLHWIMRTNIYSGRRIRFTSLVWTRIKFYRPALSVWPILLQDNNATISLFPVKSTSTHDSEFEGRHSRHSCHTARTQRFHMIDVFFAGVRLVRSDAKLSGGWRWCHIPQEGRRRGGSGHRPGVCQVSHRSSQNVSGRCISFNFFCSKCIK